MAELGNINGVYIPGDSKDSYQNDQYLNAVRNILAFGSEQNLDESLHFPIVGVSWGMLSLLKSQTKEESIFSGLHSHLVGEPLQ